MKTASKLVALRIRLNGEKVATAGIRGPHVVSAIIHSAEYDPARPRADGKPAPRGHDLHLGVGGLISGAGEHVHWANRKLKLGDRVTIEIVQTATVDIPRARSKAHSQKSQRLAHEISKRLATPSAPHASRSEAESSRATTPPKSK